MVKISGKRQARSSELLAGCLGLDAHELNVEHEGGVGRDDVSESARA